MAIVAVIYGGPRDGEVIALPDIRPIRIPILDEPRFVSQPTPTAAINVRYIEIMPVLTNHGWILPWREP